MQTKKTIGSAICIGSILVLLLIGVGVLRHRESMQGSGSRLLFTDTTLLLAYGATGIIIARSRSSSDLTAAARVGAQLGAGVGLVQIANHLIEAFIPDRSFALVVAPVFLTFALLGATGAAAWEQTRSLSSVAGSGVCCAMIGTLVTLCFAISFNLLFAARIDWQLRDAYAVSGMHGPAAFRIRNILEASSEILVRMPLLGVVLAFAGAIIHRWISRESRRRAIVAGILTPLVFAVGSWALWHANVIERVARPPFVMVGVLLVGVALCAAYPIWSSLRRGTGSSHGSNG
jgi:hypothetical protein